MSLMDKGCHAPGRFAGQQACLTILVSMPASVKSDSGTPVVSGFEIGKEKI
jgi:hypothetical protein